MNVDTIVCVALLKNQGQNPGDLVVSGYLKDSILVQPRVGSQTAVLLRVVQSTEVYIDIQLHIRVRLLWGHGIVWP